MSPRPPPLRRQDLPAIRAALGFAPAQMAERVGVSRPTWANIESGVVKLTPLLENAIRWVEHVKGAPTSDVCLDCDGRGTIPQVTARGKTGARIRCLACDGQGVFRTRPKSQSPDYSPDLEAVNGQLA